jgi:hypothetical protein
MFVHRGAAVLAMLLAFSWNTACRAQDAAPNSESSGDMDLVLGLRLGLLAPIGPATTQHLKPGLLVRPEFGIRFARYLGVRVSWAMAALSTGDALNRLENTSNIPITISSRGSLQELGLSIFAMSSVDYWGLYGELGVLPYQRLSWSQKLSSAENEECKKKGSLSGFAGKISAGARIPAGMFALIPMIEASVGTTYSPSRSSDCEETITIPIEPLDQPEHSLSFNLFLGVGGDFYFGRDWFRSR